MSDQLETVSCVAGRALNMIAKYAFPNGSVLRCIPCKKQRNCTTSEIAEYMANGFPKCKACGHAVDLVTPRDERIRQR